MGSYIFCFPPTYYYILDISMYTYIFIILFFKLKYNWHSSSFRCTMYWLDIYIYRKMISTINLVNICHMHSYKNIILFEKVAAWDSIEWTFYGLFNNFSIETFGCFFPPTITNSGILMIMYAF